MSYATIAAEAFEGCDYLREVVTPANMTSIGDRAFKSCKSLQELSIPQSKLKDIGKEAFSQCIKLQDVAIGNECGTIETSAFTGCVSLASLDRFSQDHAQYPFDIVGDYAFSNCGFKKLNLSLRSSTIYTFWGDNCFADNTSLEEVNFLSSCYMSTRMFANCKSLKNVNFKNNQTSYVYPYTFENCASLASITLPSKIWYVSEGMFHGCTALEEVKFTQYGAAESMVSLVQRNAFSGCSMLTSIDFPASLNTLDYFDDGCLSGIFKTATDSRGMTVRLHGMALHDMMQPAGQMLTADVKYGEVYTISVYFDDTCKASIEAYDPAKQLSTIMSFTD